ncbi:hypothetical protein Mapa_000302 [Marchantia paleacea]|nr:hypothetical protein Mapa_000302 [Marchantia paleacea]
MVSCLGQSKSTLFCTRFGPKSNLSGQGVEARQRYQYFAELSVPSKFICNKSVCTSKDQISGQCYYVSTPFRWRALIMACAQTWLRTRILLLCFLQKRGYLALYISKSALLGLRGRDCSYVAENHVVHQKTCQRAKHKIGKQYNLRHEAAKSDQTFNTVI